MRVAAAAASGLVVIDKPAGLTSHDVVARVRRLAGTRKVGHAGTLDPAATGVLVLGVSKATRLLTYLVGADKEYLATIRLGAQTSTDDAEGEVLHRGDPVALTRADVVHAVGQLTGEIQQTPSTVSAIKVDGQRAHARARAGRDVQLNARPVTVHAFEVLGHDAVAAQDGCYLDVQVQVRCSSGTYIRALARDLGRILPVKGVGPGVGGHVTALRRTRVGSLDLGHARTLTDLAEERENTGAIALMPMARAAMGFLPARHVTSADADDLWFGRAIAATGQPGPVAAINADGALIAVLADKRVDGALLAAPQIVLAQ